MNLASYLSDMTTKQSDLERYPASRLYYESDEEIQDMQKLSIVLPSTSINRERKGKMLNDK